MRIIHFSKAFIYSFSKWFHKRETNIGAGAGAGTGGGEKSCAVCTVANLIELRKSTNVAEWHDIIYINTLLFFRTAVITGPQKMELNVNFF